MKISLAAVLCILFSFNVYAGDKGYGERCSGNSECASDQCFDFLCV